MFESAAHSATKATWYLPRAANPSDVFGRLSKFFCEAHPNVLAIFPSEEPFDPATGRSTWRGRLTQEILDELAPERSNVFLCRPSAFMNVAAVVLKEIEVREDRTHIETFGAAPIGVGKPGQNYHIASDVEYPVVFQKSGIETVWNAEQGTLLDLAEASGLRPHFACRVGTCQSCTTRVHSVSFEYLELVDPLSADETFICCTIAFSDVVLDL